MQPSTQVLRTGVKRAAVVFLLFFVMVPASDAQQTNPAAEFLKQFNLPVGTGQVWEGTITFTQNDSKNKHEDDGGPGHTKKVIDQHTINASGTVKFCGCGRFYVSDVSCNWSEKWERGRIDSYDETMCSKKDADGKSIPYPVSPGNEDSDMEIGSRILYQAKNDKEKEALKSQYKVTQNGAVVSMTPIPYQGKYRLQAFIEVFVDDKINAESLQTEVCSQKRKHRRFHNQTVPFSKKLQGSTTGGEDDKSIYSESHPGLRLFALTEDIVLSEGQEIIKGEKTIFERKEKRPGDWNRLLVAKYELRMKNYCNDVFNALYEDLAVAEAYNDPTLRAQANGDVATYKRMVGQQAWQTYQSSGPDENANTSIQMSAGKRKKDGKVECYVAGKEKAKQSLKERCLPEVIFDAVYAHERRHVKQCNMDPDMFPPTNVEKLGVYETDAYMAGIRKYISWLELNCPKDNRLAVAKDRLAALKANRTR